MLNNTEILEGLLFNDPFVINEIYKQNMPVIRSWVLKNSGTCEDVKDLFHDALLIILRKIKKESICQTCNFSTYFVAICKHLWFQELRRRKRILLSDLKEFKELPQNSKGTSESAKGELIDWVISNLEIRERKLLELYYENKPLKEIMKALGFKNVQAVADKKKNCIKKLRGILLNCPAYKEFQIETFDSH
jgi:RNA polymerase sigma factor (sigma-70 family)